MKPTLLNRLAMKLASWSGDADRASELHGHIVEATANGHRVGFRDVGSLATLVARRAARDIPWWIAGFPMALLFFMLLVFTHLEHFPAWDVVGPDEHPRTTTTERWILATNVMAIIGATSGLIAGRVVIEQLRKGRPFGPLVFAAALVIGSFQVDLFIERTPLWRDGRLKAEHVNEVSGYSLGLFAAISMIPVVYLLTVVLLRRWRTVDRQHEIDRASLDPVALAAAGLPLFMVMGGIPLVVLSVVFTWAAKSFSTRLKVTTTVVVLAPLIAAFVWTTVLSLELDDGHPVVIYGVLVSFLVVWLRMCVVALWPLRGMRVRVAVEHKV